MNLLKLTSLLLSATLFIGCATHYSADGPRGPELVASGQTTAGGQQYAEVGVEFSTWGDFVALVSPNRWKSPIATGGSLSWLNPVAWVDDAGRTGRIFLGEAAVVGGVVAATTVSDSGGGSSSSGGSGGTTTPPPPSGGGGTVPPPPGP